MLWNKLAILAPCALATTASGTDDGSSQQQSGLADMRMEAGVYEACAVAAATGNSARPCHLHSILRHVSARGAEFDAERRGCGESSRTGGHRRADPAARSGARTRCAGHTGTRRDDSRKIHGSESRLKDALLKSEELTQRTQRITESHREIDPALSAVYVSSYPASASRSLWLFSVASVTSVLKSLYRSVCAPQNARISTAAPRLSPVRDEVTARPPNAQRGTRSAIHSSGSSRSRSGHWSHRRRRQKLAAPWLALPSI